MTRPDHQSRRGARKLFPPIFATNREDGSETVAGAINWLLRGKRERSKTPLPVAIATAYLNPAGAALLLDELEQAPRVRLLLGAEPDQAGSRSTSSTLGRGELREALRRLVSWLAAERDLTGFTREADGLAKRLVDWLRTVDSDGRPRVEVRRFEDGFLHGKAFLIDDDLEPAVLAGSSNLTLAGLTSNAELNLGYPSGQHTHLVQDWYNEFWNRSKDFPLADLYASRWDPHEPWTVFLRILWELYGQDLDEEQQQEAVEDLHLTGFQRDGVFRALRLLGRNGGVLIADEVGLGKTFVAAELLRRAAHENRQRALVVAPAALKASMWEPFLREKGFSRFVQAMSYDELRRTWQDNDKKAREDLDDYALVIVDEAHNLRNPQAQRTETVQALVGGEHPKQVVLLTATPVNNSLGDLHALLSLFIRNDAFFAHAGITSIRGYIKAAESINPESLAPEHLFDLLDRTTVRRTRSFVRKHYSNDSFKGPDGTEQTIVFPTPGLNRLDYELDSAGVALLDAVTTALEPPDDADAAPSGGSDANRSRPTTGILRLARYTPDAYLLEDGAANRTQLSNAGLLRCALLKCLESSAAALHSTLGTLIRSHEASLAAIDQGWVLTGDALRHWMASDAEDLDEPIGALDDRFRSGAARAGDYRVGDLVADVRADLTLLRQLHSLADRAAGQATEPKAERLIERLREIAACARTISPEGVSAADRRKTIVFSSFVATVQDLQRRVAEAVRTAGPHDPLADFQGRLPDLPIFGRKTGVDQRQRASVLRDFAPRTAGHGDHDDGRFDLLFTTDVLSEGVNLQQAGRIVNYDLPWNPMRVVQRHGRIDRIGSSHPRIVLDCFFPASGLERLLDLEEKLRRKLALANAAVGAGDVLPGIAAGTGQVFSDNRRQIMELHGEDTSILVREGQHGALSGEEYRRRLREAMKQRESGADALRLPWASGSGFCNPQAKQPGYVFCVRVGQCRQGPSRGSDPSRKRAGTAAQGATLACRRKDCDVCGRDAFLRFVPTTADWQPLLDAEGNPHVSADRLVALATADPADDGCPRDLGAEAYERAFDAWRIARKDVWEAWTRSTDPANLEPKVPKAFRDAAALLHDHGVRAIPQGELDRLIRCYGNVPSVRVERHVRTILRADESNARKVEQLREFARTAGLKPPPRVDPLPAVAEDEVHLVGWMAVRTGVG